jgi:hypothetical protein
MYRIVVLKGRSVSRSSHGAKFPVRERPRGRMCFNDGSRVRLRPEHTDHGWSHDFVSARAPREDGADVAPDRRTQQRVPDDPVGAKVEFGEGARIDGQCVVVSSKQIAEPLFVRYE